MCITASFHLVRKVGMSNDNQSRIDKTFVVESLKVLALVQGAHNHVQFYVLA